MSILGTHLYQCTSWHCYDRLFGFRDFFLNDFFNAFAHFIFGDLWAYLSTTHWVFSSFWPKMAWPPCLTLTIYLISSWVTFFHFPKWKKVLKGKCFADVEQVKQKNALKKALKGIKSNKFNTVLSSGKNVSMGVLYEMESTLKVTEV